MHGDSACVTRVVDETGTHGLTYFGAHLTAAQAASTYPAIGEEIAEALQVTIYDPVWGPSWLLWDRLGQRDWDNPAPPVTALAAGQGGPARLVLPGGRVER